MQKISSHSPDHRGLVATLALGTTACLAVTLIYGYAGPFGLFQDDVVALRPWWSEEFWQAMAGTYQDWPGWPRFYRPVTIAMYALLFEVFGINTAAMSWIPLIFNGLVAFLLGTFVRRETRSLPFACLTTAIYVLHPASVASTGVWIANQYQTLAAGLTVTTLLIWQSVRHRPIGAVWLWLLLPVALAGLTKESSLMLPLALLAIHWTRHAWTGDLHRPHPAFILGAITIFVAANVLRMWMLGGLGGYAEQLQWGDAIANLARGPVYTLLWPDPTFRARVALLLILAAATIGAVAAVVRRRPAEEARVALTGLVMMAVVNAPYAFMVSRDRVYLQALAAALILSAGIRVLARRAHQAQVHRPMLVVAVASALVFATAGRTRVARFTPCSWQAMHGFKTFLDQRLPLPPEMTRWMERRNRACDPERPEQYVSLRQSAATVTWGTKPTAQPTVSVSPGGRVTILVADAASGTHLRIRTAVAQPGAPRPIIEVSADGELQFSESVDRDDWVDVRLQFHDGILSTLRAMHRLDIVVSQNHAPVSFEMATVVLDGLSTAGGALR